MEQTNSKSEHQTERLDQFFDQYWPCPGGWRFCGLEPTDEDYAETMQPEMHPDADCLVEHRLTELWPQRAEW